VGDPPLDAVFPDDAGGDGASAGDAGGPDAGMGVDALAGDGALAADGPASDGDSSAAETGGDDGGVDASGPADAAPDAAEGGCPGSQGPPSALVSSAAGSYCVDSTEVTNAQYGAFLDAGVQLAAGGVPAGCAVDGGSTDYTPGAWPAPPGSDRLPVVNVTWCQAYAYCAWAGKRMCGQIGGGALAQSSFADPAASQWYSACSKGGTLVYPYGDTFDAATCGGQAAGSSLVNVGPPTGCQGGFAGLYNMSGNVWEWTDACASFAPTAACYTMGGAFDGTASDQECVSNRSWVRNASAGNIGIRCCADL